MPEMLGFAELSVVCCTAIWARWPVVGSGPPRTIRKVGMALRTSVACRCSGAGAYSASKTRENALEARLLPSRLIQLPQHRVADRRGAVAAAEFARPRARR